jgi:hypothetical protein
MNQVGNSIDKARFMILGDFDGFQYLWIPRKVAIITHGIPLAERGGFAAQTGKLSISNPPEPPQAAEWFICGDAKKTLGDVNSPLPGFLPNFTLSRVAWCHLI